MVRFYKTTGSISMKVSIRNRDAFTKNTVSNRIQSKIISYFFLFYFIFPLLIFRIRIIYIKSRRGISNLRKIKFKYLVLVLLSLINILIKAYKTIISFERARLIALRFRASPNLGRVIFRVFRRYS